MATIAAMAFRGCLFLLLTAWSTQAYTLGSPKGPASCLRVGTDRILVLIDSSAGSTPEIATVWDWQKEMTLPKPVHSSGLYEFPSCKLIYPLAGWSKFEMPEIAGHGRFLLRATGFMGHRADGLALYGRGTPGKDF